MIFFEIDRPGDVFSFALSNTRLMIIGERRLRQLMTFQDWRGDRIICVGDLTEDTNFPEGLITQECRDLAREELKDALEPAVDWDPSDFVTWVESEKSGFQEITHELLTHQRRALSRIIVSTGRDKYSFNYKFAFKLTTTRRLSKNSAVLWNLSKKEYCRRDTVLKILDGHARWKPSDIYGVMGTILLVQICHSTEYDTGVVHDNLHQGKWAGDRFEFTNEAILESRLKQRDVLWKDVSEEVTNMYLDVCAAPCDYLSDGSVGYWSNGHESD